LGVPNFNLLIKGSSDQYIFFLDVFQHFHSFSVSLHLPSQQDAAVRNDVFDEVAALEFDLFLSEFALL
jgi:hypothetical protein